jgi:hypothetical protein
MVRWLGKPGPATPDAEIVFPGHCTYETPKLDLGEVMMTTKIRYVITYTLAVIAFVAYVWGLL